MCTIISVCRNTSWSHISQSLFHSQIILRLLYLQNYFGGFRLTHSPIAVVSTAGVHAYCIIIGRGYEHRAFWVYHPTWVLTKKQKTLFTVQKYCIYVFVMTRVILVATRRRSSEAPSLVQLTNSIGGSAWTGHTIVPPMPAGRKVSMGIRTTRAGSKKLREDRRHKIALQTTSYSNMLDNCRLQIIMHI